MTSRFALRWSEHGVVYGMIRHAVKAGQGPAAAHSVSFAHSAAARRGHAVAWVLLRWYIAVSLFSRRRSEATVCQLLSNLGAVLMVFQISLSCESSLLFSSVLGSRGTPKASKTRLGGAFFSFCGQGGPQDASKVNFCSILVSFWELLLGTFGSIFIIGAALGAFWVSFFMLSGGLSLEAGFKSPK